MGKKNINSSIKNLMSGLTSSPVDTQPSNLASVEETTTSDVESSPKKRGPKPRKEKTEQISTVVRKDDMDKLRAVCNSEGYAIKDIIGAAISSFLRKYESKYGEIQVKSSNQGRISEIIDSF